jgi:hypothetical protein
MPMRGFSHLVSASTQSLIVELREIHVLTTLIGQALPLMVISQE